MSTPHPCPGMCNTAWRKAEAARSTLGTEHHIPPSWGQPTQCWECVNSTRTQLAALPELLAAVWLEAKNGRLSNWYTSFGNSSSTEHAWPGQNVRLFLDRIIGEMAELQADVLKRCGTWDDDHEVGRPSTATEGKLIGAIVAHLLPRWDWAMQNHPAADEPWGRGNANPGSQVAGWHRTLQAFTKRDPQRDVKRLAPCPRCHGPYLVESRDLRLVDDRPYIECRDPDCRRIMTSAEYEEYAKALHRAVTAAA